MKSNIIYLEQAEGKRIPSEYNNGFEGDENMSYISRGEFIQYEKRIDKHLETIDEKIDSVPSQINKDMKILLNEYDEKRRKGNKAIIGWTITGVSIVVTLAGIFIPMLPF